MARRSLAVAALALVATTHAPPHGLTYGDTLLRRIMADHPGVAALRIETAGRNGPIAAGRGTLDPARAETLPLTDSMGTPIGRVRVLARRHDEALAVAVALGRRIYTPDSLTDPDPVVAGTAPAPRAQAIVERMVDAHPLLVTLAMHVAPPGGDVVILASSFGRIGKPADADDRRVISEGGVLEELTNGGRRLTVELPQLDAKGRIVGALSTSFVVTADHDAARARADAVALRDEIARATPSLTALTARR